MTRKALKTYSLTALKMEAGETNLSWAKVILEVASKLPGFPLPGTLTSTIQIVLDDLKASRHYWEVMLGTKLSVKIGETVAVDHVSNSEKTKKLIAAQAVLISPELELADDALTYDAIRHNYQWKGRLMELQDSMMPSTRKSFCVVHPDEDFIPISILGNVHVVRSCTQANPNYANEVRRNQLSYQDRQALIRKRRELLENRA